MLALPGRPFSAKTTTEWTRTAEDGTTVSLRLEATLARDSRGRMYRENRSFVPIGSGERSRLNNIHLYDPVSRSQMRCFPRAFACVVSDYNPQTTFVSPSAGSYDQGNRNLTSENLGTDVIEGLNVTGTRETRTVNSGVLGNDRPLISTREFWYSPDLETNLAVTRIDPATGKEVIRLSQISVGDPDPHMFDVPVGYTLRDDRASARRRH